MRLNAAQGLGATHHSFRLKKEKARVGLTSFTRLLTAVNRCDSQRKVTGWSRWTSRWIWSRYGFSASMSGWLAACAFPAVLGTLDRLDPRPSGLVGTGRVLDRLFQLRASGTTVRTEILGGVTTFVTLSYMLSHVGRALAALRRADRPLRAAARPQRPANSA